MADRTGRATGAGRWANGGGADPAPSLPLSWLQCGSRAAGQVAGVHPPWRTCRALSAADRSDVRPGPSRSGPDVRRRRPCADGRCFAAEPVQRRGRSASGPPPRHGVRATSWPVPSGRRCTGCGGRRCAAAPGSGSRFGSLSVTGLRAFGPVRASRAGRTSARPRSGWRLRGVPSGPPSGAGRCGPRRRAAWPPLRR